MCEKELKNLAYKINTTSLARFKMQPYYIEIREKIKSFNIEELNILKEDASFRSVKQMSKDLQILKNKIFQYLKEEE